MSDTVNRNNKSSATNISLQNEEAMGKTLHPFSIEAMKKVQKREKDNSGFTNIDDIDWNKL